MSQIPVNQRVGNILTLSPVSLGSISEHILNVQHFVTGYVKRYKGQKTFNYFDSGFVNLTYQTKNVHFLHCNVRLSMSIHEEMELGIAAELKGKILTTYCSFMRGANRCCNHVIAALCKAVFANSHRYYSSACTSMTCDWNNQQKVIEPRRIKDIVITKKLRSKMGKIEDVGRSK